MPNTDHPGLLDCHLRCAHCGEECKAHNGDACPKQEGTFTEPPNLSMYADEAQQILKPLVAHAGAHVLIVVLDARGGFQVRSVDERIDVNVAVGALHRAASTVHTVKSLQSMEIPGTPGEPGDGGP